MLKKVSLGFMMVFMVLVASAQALKLAPVFSDHMVLQRDRPIAVYGTAKANAKVEVSFRHLTMLTIASPTGKWSLVFPAMKHGGPYQLKVQSGQSSSLLKDVLIGDVWLCSGQSNMAFPLNSATTGEAELAQLDGNPLLRVLKFNTTAETSNLSWDSSTLSRINDFKYFEGEWFPTDRNKAKTFSAVAYYFGKRIAAETQVPIGLIQMAVGGAPIESFIDREVLSKDTLIAGVLSNWLTSALLQDWVKERAAVNLKHASGVNQHHPFEPGYNYQTGISALVDFPIKGVIWYQGESNAQDVALYEHTFPMLVSSWRARWGYDFPFYYVQLSSLDRPLWPEFRDAQRKLQYRIPNTGMAVSSDLGDSLDVHPRQKKEVGERLALLALKGSYHKAVRASGPVPLNATLVQNSVLISFSEAKHLSTVGNLPLKGFELLTENGNRIYPTKATILQNQVLLNFPEGQSIKQVRYAWQPFTRANLVNDVDLPASTFSIDIKQ